jgi:hypothetical protein
LESVNCLISFPIVFVFLLLLTFPSFSIKVCNEN